MHGNVDTRLRKLADPAEALDAIVLAHAGVQRLGRQQAVGAVLDATRFVPAPGQGTLVLEGRAEDAATREALAAIGDGDVLTCLHAERALAKALDASCETPLGALAQVEGERGGDSDGGEGDGDGDGERKLLLRAWIGLPDGSAWIADELRGEAGEPEALGQAVAARLRLAGGAEMLAAAQEALR
jgi:hydroxymethylbilane synthase